MRSELAALGMDRTGSRSELMNRLRQAGIYNIDMNNPAPQPMIDVKDRYENNTNIYIGNGAGLHNKDNHKLFIANGHNPGDCIITGDFKEKKVTIQEIFNVKESEFEADLIGTEGDIRRVGSDFYMFRCTNTAPGWYPFQFGSMRII
jgi:hypothetical protein